MRDEPNKSHTHVLIVDDDQDICEALKDFLAHEGFVVRVAVTGGDAIVQAKAHHFGAVILDLGLPDMDGLDVLKVLQEADPKLPVIILTAYTTQEKTLGAVSRGAFAFLTKPYNRDQLNATIRRAVGMKALEARAETVERALTASEDRFRSVVQMASDAIVLADARGHIISWNKAAERLFQHKEAEVIGQPLTIMMPARYREAHRAGIERFLTTGQLQYFGKTLDFDGLRKDGTEFPIELSLATWSTSHELFCCGIIRDVTERRRVEEALRASEERLDLAVRGSSDGFWDGRPLEREPWDSLRSPVWWSPRVSEMLGLAETEFPHVLESWASRLHEQDKDRVFGALRAHIERKVPYDVEYRLRTKGEEYRWFRGRGQAVWDSAGHLVRMSGSLQDITDRKRADESLRFIVEGVASSTGREFFRSLVRHLAGALQVRYALVTMCKEVPATKVQTLAMWSAGLFVDNFEYDLDGTPCDGVVAGQLSYYPTDVQRLFPRDEMLAMIGAESYLGIPFINSTGAVIGHLAVMDVQPMRDEEHGISILKIFAARAGTELERIQAAEALDRLNHQRDSILNGAGDGIYGLDRQGNTTFLNPAAARMLGWEAGELIGRPMHALLHHSKPDGSPYPVEECPIHASLRDGSVHSIDDELFWRKDGGSFPVEYVSTPIHEHGEVVGAVIVFKDITERKRAEDAIRDTQERFRQVTENIREVFWMSDPQKNTILYISPAYEDIWGRTCDSLYASPRSWMDAIDPDDRARVVDASLTKQVNGHYQEEYRIVRPDGSKRWIRDRAFPIRDAAGAVYRIAGIAEDITEQRR